MVQSDYEINGVTYNCTYQDDNNVVYNISSSSDVPYECNKENDAMWLPGLTFNSTGWYRYQSNAEIKKDLDYYEDGILGYKNLNNFWDSTPKKWIAPMNMAYW